MRKLPLLSALLLAGFAIPAVATIPLVNIGPIGATPDETVRLTAQSNRIDPAGPTPDCSVKLSLGVPGISPLSKEGVLKSNGPVLSLDIDPAKLGLPLPQAAPVGNVPRWYLTAVAKVAPAIAGSTVAEKLCADSVAARVEVIDRVTGATRQSIGGN